MAIANETEAAEMENINGPFPELQGTLGIGPVLINSLWSFSKSHELVQAAKDLADCVVVSGQPVESSSADGAVTSNLDSSDSSSKPWNGFRVVFTGSLPDLSRTQAQTAAKALGAKSTPGSVSKATNLVVYGDKGGKKLQQANTFGIPTMSAEEFMTLIQENNIDIGK